MFSDSQNNFIKFISFENISLLYGFEVLSYLFLLGQNNDLYCSDRTFVDNKFSRGGRVGHCGRYLICFSTDKLETVSF